MSSNRFIALALALFSTFALVLSGCQGKAKVENTAPSDLRITFAKCYLRTGTTMDFVGDATDADGDSLTFSWHASAGTFTPASGKGKSVTWTSPSQPGQVTIRMTVTDGIANVSLAQTVTVCGLFPNVISTSTTIANQGYTYIIMRDNPVDIPAGITLTIDPGVRIVVDNTGSGFDVEGRLVAAGTAAQPIKIFGNSCTVGQNLWAGISLYGDQCQVTLKHVDISGATTNIDVEQMATLAMDTCEVFDAGTYGISVLDMSVATVRSSQIWDNRTGIYVRNSHVQIVRSSIRYSEETGIYLNASQDSVQAAIDHSEIAGNTGDGIQISERASPTIHYCTIFGNGGTGNYAVDVLQGYAATDSIHAENNYWGVGNNTQDKIARLIFDETDSPNVHAYVSFIPWLSSAPLGDALIVRGAVRGRVWAR